jgi:hypothetical protein
MVTHADNAGMMDQQHHPTKLRKDFSFQCTRIGIIHERGSFGLIVRVYEGIWYHCEDVDN